MILTNKARTGDGSGHHSVALQNVELFARQAKPVLIHFGLDGEAVVNKAREAAFKGVLSSAEAEAILGGASRLFFKGLSLSGGKQNRILLAALAKASKNNTRVDR